MSNFEGAVEGERADCLSFEASNWKCLVSLVLAVVVVVAFVLGVLWLWLSVWASMFRW